MMKQIYKYPVPSNGWIEIPEHGDVLTCVPQKGFLCAWVIFCPDDAGGNPTQWVKIMVYGTGQEIPLKAKYINTYFDDPFVWHVHESERKDKAEFVDKDGKKS